MRALAWSTLGAVLLVANTTLALSHNWAYWTWGRGDMKVFESTRFPAEAEAARRDWTYPHTHLSLLRSPKHADISLIDAPYDITGWDGLTTIDEWGLYWPWACGGLLSCRIVHAHARYNTTYNLQPGAGVNSGIRGVFCQELGHALGLAHSVADPTHNLGAYNDCMMKNYGGNSNVAGPHAWADINARY